MDTFIALGDVFWAALGGAAVWFGKDWMIRLFLGSKAFADKLEAKAAAIKAAVK